MIGKDNNIIFKTILFIISTFNIIGGAGRDRTDDLKLAKLPLSQLSYAPILVGQGGLEPPTPRLSSVCSNQLSY